LVVGPIVYALAREKLLDIRLFYIKVISWTITLGLLLAWVGLVFNHFSSSQAGTIILTTSQAILLVVLIIFWSVTTRSIANIFERGLQRIFYKEAYEADELLNRFNKIIVANRDIDQLLSKCANLLQQTLAVRYSVFAVRKDDELLGRIVGTKQNPLHQADIERLIDLLPGPRQRIVVASDLTEKHHLLRAVLRQYRIGVVVRLSHSGENEKQTGFLVIGAKETGVKYSKQDLLTITVVADALALVIQNLLKVEQEFEHVTQEMYTKNLELVETNRTLSLLRAIDAIVLESQDSLGALSSQITKAIATNSNFTTVALFAKLPNRAELELVGRNMPDEFKIDGPTPPVALKTTDPWFMSSDKTIHLRVDKELHHQKLGLTKELVGQVFGTVPVRTIYLVKLRARKKLVGIMVIGFLGDHPSLKQDDSHLLERLSQAVGVALDSKLLFDENKRVAQQLQKTNDKLRALDEAKDEFISMASHQLRTPLTSVKGYVSMVMEGDVGKISKQQRDLLSQAFASSQRMVYLIADLLNVSRLKTGKFIIENKPTQLADVVEGEIGQLTENAKSRQQELTYTKPKNFPPLMLDETKIRQVVMNFIDNALYYTPPGGHIRVTLEDTGKMVEFKVIDDGLGVPQNEQHHLFTKFFRAGNARKARPDGTGLGLFMAKKVIVAQGGAIIFNSTEGKGSTFGFAFAKDRFKLPKGAKVVSSEGVSVK
jgi:K+-sensing histidine kinase KdpD